MMIRHLGWVVAVAAVCVGWVGSVVASPMELDAALADGRDVVFEGLDTASGAGVTLNGARVGERHPPYSTFKIPNLLIALETGVEKDLDHGRHWDPVARPAQASWPKDWAQDQTLSSAFRHSVVWYFRDIAREVGTARYRAFLNHLSYGNALAPEGSDDFWLGGSLEISPHEQIVFLRRLLAGEFGFSERALKSFQTVSVLKAADGYTLHGKTGTGRVTDGVGPFEGWLVGYVERPGAAPFVYALYAHGGPSIDSLAFRRGMVERLLKEAGALPKEW